MTFVHRRSASVPAQVPSARLHAHGLHTFALGLKGIEHVSDEES